jgi:lysophospholipase L1-like esterase
VTIRLAVLGDSIAWGQGARREDERLAPRLVAGLEQAGHEVELRVLAVRGARSADLAPQVDRALTWSPLLVLVVIGANDLTHRVRQETAVQDLALGVRRLVAAGAEVVVAPAPDLSAVPHVPPQLRAMVKAAGDRFRRAQVTAVRTVGGRVADPGQEASRAFAADEALFSADRFHPSSEGYAAIARAVLPTLLDAAGDVERAG